MGRYSRMRVARMNKRTRGGDLVSTLPGCVCRKVKEMGSFLVQVSEMTELISVK